MRSLWCWHQREKPRWKPLWAARSPSHYGPAGEVSELGGAGRENPASVKVRIQSWQHSLRMHMWS